MKTTSNLKISQIKGKMLTLRGNYQVPYELASRVLKITVKSDLKYLEELMKLTEFYLRVKYFYKKYPLLDKEYSKTIRTTLAKWDT